MNIGECLGGRYIITNSTDSVLSSIARYSIDVNSPSSVILNNSLDEKIAATPPPQLRDLFQVETANTVWRVFECHGIEWLN